MTSAPPAIRLTSLHVKNFRALRDVTVDFTPLTVLVGPNDSGKTLLLEALRALARATHEENGWTSVFPQEGDWRAATFDGSGGPIEWQLKGRCDGKQFEYRTSIGWKQSYVGPINDGFFSGPFRVSIKPDSHVLAEGSFDGHDEEVSISRGDLARGVATPYLSRELGKHPSFVKLRSLLDSMRGAFAGLAPFRLVPDRLRAPVPVSATGCELASDGFGLAHVIADLWLADRDRAQRIQDELRRAMPMVEQISTRHQSHGSRGVAYILELTTRGKARVPASAISDGVLLYLAYLTLIFGPRPTPVLLLEEPESGIHPGRLTDLVRLLRALTEGTSDRPPVQVILTTHSPLLLNEVAPEEIRIVQRTAEAGTQVTRFTDVKDLNKLLEYQGPGEIWINEEVDAAGRAESGR